MTESVSFLDLLMVELVVARPIVELLIQIVRRWHDVRETASIVIWNKGRL